MSAHHRRLLCAQDQSYITSIHTYRLLAILCSRPANVEAFPSGVQYSTCCDTAGIGADGRVQRLLAGDIGMECTVCWSPVGRSCARHEIEIVTALAVPLVAALGPFSFSFFGGPAAALAQGASPASRSDKFSGVNSMTAASNQESKPNSGKQRMAKLFTATYVHT
jgi:hypothetical protein